VRLRTPLLSILALAALAASGCGGAKRVTYGFQGEILDTRFNVTLAGSTKLDREGYREVSQRIQTRLAEVFTETSRELTFSDLTRINEAPAGEPIEISAEMVEILTEAQRIAEETRGAFDVTRAALVEAWGVSRDGAEGKVPTEAELREAARRIGWTKLELDQDEKTVTKLEEGLKIDLEGMEDGYAADCVSAALLGMGWNDHAVQVGEEVLTRGVDRLGRPWKISIQRAPGSGGTIPISGRAIAVSGNDEWFRVSDGEYYPKRMDPRSGRPIEHNVLSASVVSEAGAKAGAYSEALAVMEPEEGIDFAERHDLAALILVQNDDQQLEERMTSSFARLSPTAETTAAVREAVAVLARK